MKKSKISLLLIIFTTLAASTWFIAANDLIGKFFNDDDPDLPMGAKIDREEYFRLRNENLDLLRGYDTAKQDSRTNAIIDMERSERALKAKFRAANQPDAASWVPLGPSPIPVNGSTSYSGRVSAIAVHPTNPDIAYVGTAQGGLYRTLNGGTTWTPMMDSALTIAIGAVAIAPSDPTTVFVGTGEAGLCGSGCYIGVGLYRITNADTSPVLSAALNKNAANADVFTGRAVSEIIVHPTDPNILFAATTSGIAGIGATTSGAILPSAGIYRTTNAMAANPTFQQLTIQGTLNVSRSVTDLAIEPDNPNRLVAGVIGSGGDGGVYLSTDALAATPTFTRTLTNGDGSSLGRTEFAVNKTGAVVTIYAATGTSSGTLYKSVDGGATFPASGAQTGFCSSQCFYDIAVAVDPTDVNKVYLGGSPSLVFGRSTNGAASTFTNSSNNLHVDTQAFAIAPSNPNIVYFGSDGGIWRTTNVSATPIVWNTLNNSTISATQFMGLAIHPLDRNYLLGGTQDNGTEFLAPDGTTWIRSDGGDGGFAVIDQNAPDTTNVVGYHTYYNQTNSQIGFSRATTTVPPGDPNWVSFLGCSGTTSNNGIVCGDAVLFYAPMVGGPNAPGSVGNTLYFGTSRLYRSINQGTTMTDVSGILPGGVRISAIGIAPQNDDIRLVGTTAGSVFLSTTAGATTMTNVTGSIPVRYIGRVAIDPTDANKAYVALNGFGLASGQHVWKTTNLLSGSPAWTAAGNGIPDTPINAFVVDPVDPNTLYAGADIGVFKSSDGGANWIPFSNGLPRVAVFGLAIQPTNRVLRIATHGRGIWEMNLNVPNSRTLYDFDGDGKTDISIFRPGPGEWWVQNSSNSSVFAAQFGASTDKMTPGDFTGDGKADLAIWRPTTGEWFVLRSEDLSFYAFPFGTAGDVPAPADYDGDGKTDAAVFRPSTSTWFINNSGGGTTIQAFGAGGDVPVAADYDGDGKADIAIYRPLAGQWWLQRSTAGLIAYAFGGSADKTVPGDYTGDGKADVAIWRPSTGEWFVLRSENQSFYSFPFGTTGDVPASGDYDGDGKFDATVFRPSSSTWFANRTTAGVLIQQFGITGDLPVPSAFVR